MTLSNNERREGLLKPQIAKGTRIPSLDPAPSPSPRSSPPSEKGRKEIAPFRTSDIVWERPKGFISALGNPTKKLCEKNLFAKVVDVLQPSAKSELVKCSKKVSCLSFLVEFCPGRKPWLSALGLLD